MKTFNTKLLTLLFYFIPVLAFSQIDTTEFVTEMLKCPELSIAQSLEGANYEEKYVVYLTNKLDWSDQNSETFQSRVIVCFKGMDRPTVIVTEGYYAHYALFYGYEDEISHLFDTNVIVCEHRYYGESVPENADWKYLTLDNALADLHHARTVFGRIFSSKWISTGISKGGQTTMFYRAYYPEDVDISVSYVAPLNKNVEDGRHEPFLANKVGTEEQRNQLFAAQREILSRKSTLLSRFEELCKKEDYEFQAPIEDIYDYCVFELPFAFWQWGTPFSRIPTKTASDDEWFRFFTTISEPDYFSYPTPTTPFFVQAAYELGYYGYSMEGLEELCSVKSTHNYLKQLMLPPDAKEITFHDELYNRTVKYLKENDPRHIFIYGENDPWSSSGVIDWLDCSEKNNMRIYIQPRGSHTARIRTMPNKIYREIMTRLTEWLQ